MLHNPNDVDKILQPKVCWLCGDPAEEGNALVIDLESETPGELLHTKCARLLKEALND
jgi:hypothetical protein